MYRSRRTEGNGSNSSEMVHMRIIELAFQCIIAVHVLGMPTCFEVTYAYIIVLCIL